VSGSGAPGPADRLPSIYALTDRQAAGGLSHPEIAARLFRVGVRLVQVREKALREALPDRVLLDQVEECVRLARESGSRLVVNDRVDVARLAGTGVHLGGDDLAPAAANAQRVPGTLLGVSTHSIEEARAAFRLAEPDYVAFGPVFASGTKTARGPRGLDALAAVASLAERTKPLVAIGGIEAGTLASVLDAGADSAAVVGALYRDGRIEENARVLLDSARRRRRPGRVYLVGFMASGKSSIGARVAERLGVPFVDLDREIERTSGKTVRALFESEGEAAFRDRETAFLAATEALPDAIVATGGGCYVRDDNRERIRRLGAAVLLDVDLPVLLQRLSGKIDRPLFSSPEQAAALWADRSPFYRMGSIPVALADGSVEESADRVLIALEARVRGDSCGI